MGNLSLTDNIYLILFSSVTIVLSIIFLILGLTLKMEYNLAINLFTSFLTTSLTVFFLDMFLSYRKQKQWKEVRNNALFEIAMETMSIFSEIIDLVDGQFNALTFKMTIIGTKDSNTRKALIYSKIKGYNNSKPLKLAVNRLSRIYSISSRTSSYLGFLIEIVFGMLQFLSLCKYKILDIMHIRPDFENKIANNQQPQREKIMLIQNCEIAG